jgi:hypothetical protein
MVLPSVVLHLHVHRSLIGLNGGTVDQLSSHGRDHGNQQLAYFQNPTTQRCPAEFQTSVSLQNRTLSLE